MNKNVVDIIAEILKIRKMKKTDVVKVIVTTNYDGSKEINDNEVEVITTLRVGVVTKFPTEFPSQEQTDFEVFIDKGICTKENFDDYCTSKRKELAEFKVDLFESIFRNIGCSICSTYDSYNTWDYEI